MEEEIEVYEEDAASSVANLTSALSNLTEVDSKLLSKTRQAKLAKMKRQIFDALVYYCEMLPELEDKDEE